ncbi:MAG: Asp-tRNA(Asn)/Glu-tRNA(Gln) amidotransferase subunit GatC [Antricoccus sp.]
MTTAQDDSAKDSPTITRDDVAHLAHLARLSVTDDEIATFATQLGSILQHVRSIGEVAAADIVPMTHNVPMTNVTRPDEVRPSLDRDEVLAVAPAAQDGRFRVPRILDEEA